MRVSAVPRIVRGAGGLAAAVLLGLPLPPVPLPSAPPLPSPPALPTSLPPLVSPLPIATPPIAASPPSLAQPPAAATPAAAPQPNPRRGIVVPFTGIFVDAPISIAVLVALAVLPLLFGIWLLLFGRTLGHARRLRDAQVRLMLAADLGLRPRDLASISTRSLFDLREKSAFDELTGVLRRAAGISAAEREIARARRHGAPLTVAFIDVDGLQEANEARGHGAGDALLRGLTEALKEGLREEDILVRYGGDEFVCVLPDTSTREARTRLGGVQAAAGDEIRFCFGVAELQRSDDVVSLLARADRDLYDFKANRGEIVQLPKTSPHNEDGATA